MASLSPIALAAAAAAAAAAALLQTHGGVRMHASPLQRPRAHPHHSPHRPLSGATCPSLSCRLTFQVMNKLIDLADFDGDGSINYAEFARIFTAENIHGMKQTLQAVESTAHEAKVRYEMSQGGKGKLDKETGENVRLRRTGPGLEKMRKAHRTLRNIILTVSRWRCANRIHSLRPRW